MSKFELVEFRFKHQSNQFQRPLNGCISVWIPEMHYFKERFINIGEKTNTSVAHLVPVSHQNIYGFLWILQHPVAKGCSVIDITSMNFSPRAVLPSVPSVLYLGGIAICRKEKLYQWLINFEEKQLSSKEIILMIEIVVQLWRETLVGLQL